MNSKEISTINSTVINNEYLYFIVIDNKNNMFEHYFETIIHNSYINILNIIIIIILEYLYFH